MNPRQRRGVLLMVLSGIAAAVVFIGVSGYVRDVNTRVGPMVTVYQVTKDVPAFTTLSNENTEPVQVPERWAAANTRLESQAIDGRVTAVALSAGAPISPDVLLPPSVLDPSEREVAVNVDAVTGLVGRVRPGDRVDVYAVFADVPGLPQQARILVQNVRVVSIQGQRRVPRTDSDSLQNVIPVSLALDSESALSVTYANTFAEEVRLIGLPPGVAQDRSKEQKTYDAADLGGQAVPVEPEG